MRRSILFMGAGGQGIVTSSEILAEALFKRGLYVSTLQGYGAEVRGGPVFSYVVFDEEPIENPFVEEFDIAVVMHKRPLRLWRDMLERSRLVVYDPDLVELEKGVPIRISETALKKGVRGSENIIAVGVVVAVLGLGTEVIDVIKSILSGSRAAEKNIRALEIGYAAGAEAGVRA